jgi:hypothetical protein
MPQTLTRTARPVISAIDSLREVHDELLKNGHITAQKFNTANDIKAAYLSCMAVADRTYRLLPDIAGVIREADAQEARSNLKPWLKSRFKEGLGKQQCEAFDAAHEWFFSGGEEFLLEGGAGTGKSFVLSRIIQSIQELDPRGVRLKVAGGAPTHEAVKVIRRFIQGNEIKDITIATLHSLLSLKPGDFQANGKRKMVRNMAAMGDRFEDLHLACIDECSMLNDEMMRLFPRSVSKFFMGDRCQLAPIDDDDATDRTADPKLSLSFNIKAHYELTDVHRYDGAIAETALSWRRSILFGERPKLSLGENLVRLSPTQWTDDFIQRVEAGEDTKALLYTNAAVVALNQAVRSALSPNAPKYIVGDRLRAKEPIMKALDRDEWLAYAAAKGLTQSRKPVNDEEQIIMATSAECLVTGVGETELKLWHPLGMAPTLRCYELQLQTDDDLLFTKTAIHCDDRTEATNYLSSIVSGIYQLAPGARGKAWRSYFELLAALNLSGKAGSGKNGATKFNDRLQYGWAITTHQAQGATIAHVFADFGNISRCASPLGRKQLQYTALTRAAENCFLKID